MSLRRMIDVRTEQLLPIEELPAYLESRGLGKTVTMQVVDRWIREGCNGARLEVVRIEASTLTSLEAVQRWVAAQSRVPRGSARTQDIQRAHKPPTPAPLHTASERVLAEFRAAQTELDKVIKSLPGFAGSTLAHVAGTLFQAALRNQSDVLRLGAERLLKVPRLGPASKRVVLALLKTLESQVL